MVYLGRASFITTSFHISFCIFQDRSMTEVIRSDADIGCGDAFDFSNCSRNMALEAMGVKPPTMTSTGTTIVAATYKVLILFFCFTSH